MTEALLSAGWFEAARVVLSEPPGVPEVPGLTGRLRIELTDVPSDDGSRNAQGWWDLVDGVPVDGGPGAPDPLTPVRGRSDDRAGNAGSAAPPADATLTLTDTDARAVLDGSLDPSVAFMQGRMKVAGSMGLVLALLSAVRSPGSRAVCSRLGALSDPPG